MAKLMLQTPAVQMIATELSLLLCVLLASQSNAQCPFDRGCNQVFQAGSPDDSKASVSMDCGESVLSITVMVGDIDELNVESMELVCTNLTGSLTFDLRCPNEAILSELPPMFLKSVYTATINYTLHDIQPGDQCYIRGCYRGEFTTGPVYKVNSTATECTIPRDCELSEWGNWTECNENCRRTRNRSIVLPALGDGQSCESLALMETTDCDTWKCPEDCSAIQCHKYAECHNTSEGPQCNCSEGYTGNGTYCTVIEDPCANDTCQDCSAIQCHEYAECHNTSEGPQCNCSEGYTGNGTYCTEIEVIDPCVDGTCHSQGASWSIGIAVVIILLLFVLVFSLAVCITVHIVTGRKRRLDHKHVEKFMGTFDPNFTPHLSTNLRKYTAQSEQSVFDTLWYYPPPDNDYITMDELGAHIRSNKHARDTDSESSLAIQTTTADLRPKMSHASLDASEVKSNFSLDLNTVHTLFKMGYAFQNTNCQSGDEYGGLDNTSVASEPRDFVEDILRIDIGGLSETDDGKYLSVASSCDESVQFEQTDFVENAFRIDIDDDSVTEEPEREYVNVVGGVSFSYPSDEDLEPNNDKCNGDFEDQLMSSLKFHSSMPAVNRSSSDDSLSSHTQSLYASL